MSSRVRRCYEAVRESAGAERVQSVGPLDARDAQRFTVAVRGREPAPGEPVHPLFLTSVLGWAAGPAEDDLRQDGLGPDDTRGLPTEDLRVMGAGQEIVVHREPEPGTPITVHTSITDARFREGHSGELLIVRVRRRFTDDSGHDLVTCHETFLAR
ncbi:FAS1-like dehydratase domain-containing protein [Amycolatopsis thermoflava]|uniref:FAS1-like dehydratase domain-containing protein n=1 Tax=Amycolatopsis thermoflava TaxID=84480 RepID=UPI003D73D24A